MKEKRGYKKLAMEDEVEKRLRSGYRKRRERRGKIYGEDGLLRVFTIPLLLFGWKEI